MKIILDQSQQQEHLEQQQQQQFIIVQSQSLASKPKLESDDAGGETREEILYVLKDENNTDQQSVIQLDSNCGNQEQFVWIANDQATDGTHDQGATTMYTIKEVNYSQVRTII